MQTKKIIMSRKVGEYQYQFINNKAANEALDIAKKQNKPVKILIKKR